MPSYDEENLGSFLSALPPAPEAWVRAAQEHPARASGRSTRSSSVPTPTTSFAVSARSPISRRRSLEEAEVVAHAETVEILRRRLDK